MYTINQKKYIEKILLSLPANTVKYIFLIGSYAKGTNAENSDVDFIVVSNSFEDINGFLRAKIVSMHLLDLSPKADIVCLTEREFNKYKQSQAYKYEVLKLIYKGEIQ